MRTVIASHKLLPRGLELQSLRLKALKLAGYSARSRRPPEALQQALFPYLEAL